LMPTRGVARLENAHRRMLVRSGMESRRPRGSLVCSRRNKREPPEWLHVRALLSVYELALVRCCAVLP
jgi:hypothetical protein